MVAFGVKLNAELCATFASTSAILISKCVSFAQGRLGCGHRPPPRPQSVCSTHHGRVKIEICKAKFKTFCELCTLILYVQRHLRQRMRHIFSQMDFVEVKRNKIDL